MKSKEQIRTSAIRRMEEIESKFTSDIPKEIMSYYLLNFLIANGLRRYVDCHGLYPLDTELCTSGRELAGFGQLSFFEKDCVSFLNEYLYNEEEKYAKINTRLLAVYRS